MSHHIGEGTAGVDWMVAQFLLATPFIMGILLYVLGVVYSYFKGLSWPSHRTLFWLLGSAGALLAVVGPIAEQSHASFTAHMIGHLLLGMFAPLLMVLAAPVTLALRTLPKQVAKEVSLLFRSFVSRFFIHPLTASLLNIGGLWILYTTGVFNWMHDHSIIFLFVHLHVFVAGYLFTSSMLYIDPIPHRKPFLYRSIVLIGALAGHGILSKWLYAYPPAGVPDKEAKLGAMLMYYGGDAVDIAIVSILCYQWYKAARPRLPQSYAENKG